MSIRSAEVADCQRILDIYAPAILDSAASFELELPPLSEFEKRFLKVKKKFPWLVYEKDNQIAGYAYASSHRERVAYQWSAEVSVYLAPQFQGQGIGTQLYRKLFPMVKALGIRNVYAGITLPNVASEKIHQKMGFQSVGVYQNVGFKFSRWHDVAWYALELQSNHPHWQNPK